MVKDTSDENAKSYLITQIVSNSVDVEVTTKQEYHIFALENDR